MKTVYSEDHKFQDSPLEFIRGKMVPSLETPERVRFVLSRLNELSFGQIVEPRDFGIGPIERVHDGEFVDFLKTASERWRFEVGSEDAVPNVWVPPRSPSRHLTERVSAQLSRYATDVSSPITSGTWRAITASANVAISAAEIARVDGSAFALCRPPGHHAGRDYFGGYCFLNNAAIAAQHLLDSGADRVAVLDIDYHHGNGTQDIFYETNSAFTVSIHANPSGEYPHYSGYASERGAGAGIGCNMNLPLEFGTDYRAYADALATALFHLRQFGPTALVVSLGVDTYGGDPFSRFRLVETDFIQIGRAIATLNVPTVFVFEGGYASPAIGVNVVNVLTGFEGR